MKIYVVTGTYDIYGEEGSDIILVSTDENFVKENVERFINNNDNTRDYDDIKVEVWNNDAYCGYLTYDIETVKKVIWNKEEK